MLLDMQDENGVTVYQANAVMCIGTDLSC